ncbi:hypothetical protein GCM10018790_57300 [Kitasatospora xanthocidica]|uniref:TetR-like C-terminal domain-containing protein n=1 Tax=Kitasatospora xanthocidica TaxID=83382 RepID=UPI0019BFFEBE|nr:TetR-like C-terminal domain-containing protein [Kitasatospora xanthocidica]GHF71895.1 hypothetical protein GCM10018790_57300 [Kitasatospora xanthocidica]
MPVAAGTAASTLYRYFAGRDELITELVRDAYRSLADTLADAAADGADLAGLARALRGRALADPQRYFLVYGTPVPGYRAPEDTVALADRIMRTLLDACAALPPNAPGAPDAPEAPFAARPASGRGSGTGPGSSGNGSGGGNGGIGGGAGSGPPGPGAGFGWGTGRVSGSGGVGTVIAHLPRPGALRACVYPEEPARITPHPPPPVPGALRRSGGRHRR